MQSICRAANFSPQASYLLAERQARIRAPKNSLATPNLGRGFFIESRAPP